MTWDTDKLSHMPLLTAWWDWDD